MAEYIDREQVLNLLKSYGIKRGNKVFGIADIGDVVMSVEDLHTADVEPVRHGKWEFPIFTDYNDGLDPRVKCSECGGIEAAFARWKYCPNCGAKIDLEEGD